MYITSARADCIAASARTAAAGANFKMLCRNLIVFPLIATAARNPNFRCFSPILILSFIIAVFLSLGVKETPCAGAAAREPCWL
jgi:hypothetical protein